MLKQTIKDESVTLLKAGKTEESVMLRNILAEISNVEIECKHELTDVEIIGLLRRQVKKLEEAALMFEEGGRDDLAEANKLEVEALAKYLPAEINDEELERKVRIALEGLDPAIQGGRRIGEVVKRLAGSVESGRVSKMVQKLLAQ